MVLNPNTTSTLKVSLQWQTLLYFFVIEGLSSMMKVKIVFSLKTIDWDYLNSDRVVIEVFDKFLSLVAEVHNRIELNFESDPFGSHFVIDYWALGTSLTQVDSYQE